MSQVPCSEPAVALESSVIAQGLPRPANLVSALAVEKAVRDEGAIPRTTAIVDGRIRAGLSHVELERLAGTDGIIKASVRDLAWVAGQGITASTTVASTAWIALRQGIRVMATGGLGGVHRPGASGLRHDVSADLPVLARTPILVVCSGPKAILDVEATRERLETDGVTVVGFGTDTMPSFWFADSGFRVDIRCDTVSEVADIVRARDRMHLHQAIVVVVPPPDPLDPEHLGSAIENAVAEANRLGLRSGAVTPFVLSRLRETAGDALLTSNMSLLENNARVAARIAVRLASGSPRRA